MKKLIQRKSVWLCLLLFAINARSFGQVSDDEAAAKEWYNQGISAGKQLDFKDAAKYYTNAIELKPDLYPAYFYRGISEAAMLGYELAKGAASSKIVASIHAHMAIDDFDVYIKSGETQFAATAYTSRGECDCLMGEYEQGVLDCTYAITLDPTYADAYQWRATCVYSMGVDYEFALRDLHTVLKLKPGKKYALQLIEKVKKAMKTN